MDIQIIFKIAGLGIVLAVITQVLKSSGKEDIATAVSLIGVVVVLVVVIGKIASLFNTVKTMFQL